MTTVIPCRAQNPDTCVYHGAQRRADAALLRGDSDTWLRETETMLRNSDIDEVQTFIKAHAATPAPTVSHIDPTAAIENGLAQAEATHPARYAAAVQDLNDNEAYPGYNVGGTGNDTAGNKTNAYRRAYQQIANDILELSTAQTYGTTHTTVYEYDQDTLQSRILDHETEARDDGDHQLVTAYAHAYNLAQTWDGTGGIGDTQAALQNLDTAYYNNAAQLPVPEIADTEFDDRFEEAHMVPGGQPFHLHDTTPHTHNLTPYQQTLHDIIGIFDRHTRETDTGLTETQVLTHSRGNHRLADILTDHAEQATDPDVHQAHIDARQLVNSSIPVYQQPDSIDSYDLYHGMEKLFRRSIPKRKV